MLQFWKLLGWSILLLGLTAWRVAAAACSCSNGGTCDASGNCTCTSGWTGTTCTTAICSPICQNGGSCTGPNTCTCPSGWNGTTCTNSYCLSACQNGGTCTGPNTCTCASGYNGTTCTIPVCNPSCSNGGTCSSPNNCSCASGWAGKSCRYSSAWSSIATIEESLPTRIAYWPLAPLQLGNDVGPNQIHGTVNGTWLTATGPNGAASSIMSVRNATIPAYLTFTSPLLNFSSASWTVAMYVKTGAGSGAFWDYSIPGTIGGANLWQYPSSNNLWINPKTNGVTDGAGSACSMSGVWQFVGATYDSTNHVMKMFCNASSLSTTRTINSTAYPATSSTAYIAKTMSTTAINATVTYACASLWAATMTDAQMLQVKSLCPLYLNIACNSNCAVGACRIDLTTTSGYYCTSCVTGWQGSQCTTPICNNACQNSGACTAPNTCTCTSSWTGTTCTIPVCNPSCSNGGNCTAPNVCNCATGWNGASCASAICNTPCSNGGTCSSPNTCTCTSSWSGTTCTIPVCNPSCSNGGTCTAPNVCNCATGWNGAACASAICNTPCSNGATCSSPNTCTCASGWNGTYCTSPICTSACQNGGTCSGAYTCTCTSSYTGATCSIPICTPACANGGTCSAPNTCTCATGWNGTTCNSPICNSACQNGGTCTGPNTCTCTSSYNGTTCTIPVCNPSCSNGGTCSAPNICICSNGWNGTTCAIPYCLSACQNGGTCSSANTCSCATGWTGKVCTYATPWSSIATILETLPTRVAYWPLTPLQMGNDAGPNRVDGVVSGNWMLTTGPYGAYNTSVMSQRSAATPGYLTFSSPLLNFSSSSWTVAMFVKTGTGDAPFWDYVYGTAGGANFWQDSTTKLWINGKVNGVSSAASQNCSMVGVWQFVGATYDATNHVMKMFCNSTYLSTQLNINAAAYPATSNTAYIANCMTSSMTANATYACASLWGATLNDSQMLQVKSLCPLYLNIACNSNCAIGACHTDLTTTSGYYCTSCVTGWQGSKCLIPVCNNTCQNGGTCTAPSTCTCTSSYSGATCTIPVCNPSCSNGGTCTNPSVCSCATGWNGTTCTAAICNNACQNGGTCSAPDTCTCATGWNGTTCNKPICTSACQNGATCTAPNTCTCTTSYNGTTCTIPVCNPSCQHGATCSSPNVCTCATGWNGTLCQSAICNSTCQNGATCSAPNTCTCATGWNGTVCTSAICTSACTHGGTCSSPNTCTCATGWNGTTCASPICTNACVNGNCTAPSTCTCKTGWNGTTCASPICTSACMNGGTCTGPNTCSCATGWNGTTCTAAICTSACLNGATCSAPNTCTCVTGWNGTTCGSAICNSICQNGGTCSSPNACTCATGWNGTVCTSAICTSTCMNGGTCSGPNTCTCATGWNGTTCTKPICTNACVNGNCTAPNTCTCKTGWNGTTCASPICTSNCMNGGTCTGPNTCSCATGWNGTTCTSPICTSACLNGGTCSTPNTCTCATGWNGTTCGSAICNSACQNGATCTSPNTCTCTASWNGTTCTIPVCNPSCKNGGTCSAPNVCTCATGWNGTSCASPICNSACQNGGTCTGPNTCQCASGWNGTVCTSPICTSVCQNGGTCSGPNTCICAAGWNGTVCASPICPSACKNGGTCSAPNTCTCATGWNGTTCNSAICATNVCQNGGTCSAPEICTCQSGWNGTVCTIPVCSPTCKNGGTCGSPFTCTCTTGWNGTACTSPICTIACQNGGTCSAPNICQCATGWSGAICTTPICSPACNPLDSYCSAPNVCSCYPGIVGDYCNTTATCNPPCSGNGFCVSDGQCTCISGWAGGNCTTPFVSPPDYGYAFDYSWNKTGNCSAIFDFYLPYTTPPIVQSSGAIRLVAAVDSTKGSMWAKTPMALWDFMLNATVQIGQTGQIGDGFGIFIGNNLQRATTYGVGSEYTVNWANFTGLAVLFSPRYGLICAMESTTAKAFDRTCNSTAVQTFKRAILSTILREKVRIGIVVRNNGSRITVDMCTVMNCTTYLDNMNFTSALSAINTTTTYFGIAAQSSNGTTDFVDVYDLSVYSLANCSSRCNNGGYCLSNGTCRCQTGWVGADCSIATCMPSCDLAGWCTGLNYCTCAPGWYGSTCSSSANCSTPCSSNAFCTLTNQCKCLAGWDATTNCTTSTQWTYPVDSGISWFTMEKGNTTNYDLYLWNTTTNPQPGLSLRLLPPTPSITSYLFAKIPISNMPHFNLNVTVQISNNYGTVGGDGFAIEFTSNKTIQRQSGNNVGWISAQRAGLALSVSPRNSVISLAYSATPADLSLLTGTGQVANYSIVGHPHLRQKMQFGLTFDNYALTTVYMCNVTSCKNIFENMTGLNIASLPSPVFMGITGANTASNYDSIDIYDIKVYTRDRTCSPKCRYGKCDLNTLTCVCSPGYTGVACESAVCEWPCMNGGTCISPNACMCTNSYTGYDCGLRRSGFMKVAVDYQLNGATTLSTIAALSGADCATKCKANAACKGANYRAGDRACFLLNKDYSSSGALLNCSAGYSHYTMDGWNMPNYIAGRQMACAFMNGACPKLYQTCQPTCQSNRWVGACTATTYYNCSDALAKGNTKSGVYLLNPDSGTPFEAYCEMENDAIAGGGGGYVTVLRRRDGSLNFALQTLTTMRNFIGDLYNEFWIGADNLYRLTNAPSGMSHELLYLLWPFEPDGNIAFGRWSVFSVGSYSTGYLMNIPTANFSSTTLTVDIMRNMHNNVLRTSSNDANSCVAVGKGPIWAPSSGVCSRTNPFGSYLYGTTTANATGIVTQDYLGLQYSMRSIEWRIK